MRLLHRRSLIVLVISAMAIGIVTQGPAASMVSAGSGRPHRVSLVRAAAQGLAVSPKPDWRGADLGNTGRLPTYGAIMTPTQVFSAKPVSFGNTYGIELDGAGNVIFTTGTAQVYSYTPAGVQNWAAILGTTIGADVSGPPSHPVVSSDGNVYIGADNGNLYQINASTGAFSAIFGTPGGVGLQQTPKIGADNTLYIGGLDGTLYHLSTTNGAAPLYTFGASGSVQTSGPAAGTTSVAPFKFYGEVALDGAGNAYAASTDTNPASGFLGTLYKVDPTGNLVWKMPLQNASLGAVMLAANPAVPGQTLVIVADRTPEVNAFDAATGAVVWTFTPTDVNYFKSSPALSPDGRTVYINNNQDALYALNTATGALQTGFNGTGFVPIGANDSPVVDAAGDVYMEISTGDLQGYSPTGALLWTIPNGGSTGQSGTSSPNYMSPAIGTDGTIYMGGNKALVRGFLGALPPTNTPAPTITPGGPTETPTGTPTASPTTTPSPTATTSPTPSLTPSATSTPSTTPTPSTPGTTGTAVTATASGTPTSTSTPTQTPTQTASPTVTPTQTASRTTTLTTTPSGTAVTTETPTDVPTDSPTETPAGSPTETPTASILANSAVTTTLEIHNYPRTILLTQPRTASCDLATNEQHLEDGCIRIATITAPKSFVTVILTYPDGTPQIFSEVNDARGHSLHVYNIVYAPPAKAGLPRGATIVNVTAIVIFPGSQSSAVASTRFRVAPPPDAISVQVGRKRRP